MGIVADDGFFVSELNFVEPVFGFEGLVRLDVTFEEEEVRGSDEVAVGMGPVCWAMLVLGSIIVVLDFPGEVWEEDSANIVVEAPKLVVVPDLGSSSRAETVWCRNAPRIFTCSSSLKTGSVFSDQSNLRALL